MDTRSKILSIEAARALEVPGLVVVTGYFDLMRAAHVCDLETLRRRTGAIAMLAAVLPWDDAVLNHRARAEMAAALRMLDYVVAIDRSDVSSLIEALRPADVVHLEAADARRNRELIDHVHRRLSL